MKKAHRYILPFSIFIVWLFIISGIVGITFGDAQWFIEKTPINLLVLFAILIVNFPIKQLNVIAITIFFLFFGFFIEWVGVHFGFPFGDYHYGDNLGIKIAGIPPLIGINWALLTLITGAIAQHFIPSVWLRITAGAFLMVALDFFIEPLAPTFDFWHWELGHAPLQNFVGWFAIAWLLQLFYAKSGVRGQYGLSANIYVAQFIFFLYFFVYGI